MNSLYLLLSLAAVAAGQSCLPGFIRNGNSCYFTVTSQLDWFDADQYCTSLSPYTYNVHLLTLETASEESFIRQQISGDSVLSDRDIWIGASQIDKNKGWSWAATQQAITYNNWEPGLPSGSSKCGFMSWWYDYQWDNEGCNNRKAFICEYALFAEVDHAHSFENLPEDAACPSNFYSFGKSCYYFVPSSLNWFDADQYCTMLVPRTYRVHLASIESSSEQIFLQDIISSSALYRNRQYWTSGNYMDRIQGWHWANNQRSISFTNWASGEPNGSGNCIQLWEDRNYAWDDADCEDVPYSHGFICEVDN